jgi:protein-arginine kinase activator protein McsA
MIPRKARTKAKLKKRIICKKCFIVFENISLKNLTDCPNCGKIIDARIRTEESRIYNKKNPDRLLKYKQYDKTNKKERGKISRERVRKVVFNLLSNNNPICENCNCDDVRLLEVNHKNGGGSQELKGGKDTNKFMWDIYMGRRKTEDLNLLCRVCNALHYLELKYGKTKHTIIYK